MINKNKALKKKISLPVILLSISPSFIFIAIEGTFLVRSIIPLIGILVIYSLFRLKKFRLSRPIKWFIALELVFFVSTLINSLIYSAEISVLIQIIYQFGIFLWFSLLLQRQDYSKEEINTYMNAYICVCLLCSSYVIVNNIVIGRYASSVTNLLGYRIGKNFYGALMCLGPIYALLKILYSDKHKTIYIAALFVMLIGIVFTNSRGTLLALSISILVLLFQYGQQKLTKKRMLVLCIVIVVGLLSIKPILNLIPTWMFRRYFINSYADGSNTDRLMRWKNALEGIAHSPLIGFGPGVFSLIPEYMVTDFGKTISDATYSHNTYLDIMVNGGVIGLICFLGVIFSTIKDTIKHNIVFLPVIICLFITSGILGAGKSVYFWNNLIFCGMVSVYSKNHRESPSVF